LLNDRGTRSKNSGLVTSKRSAFGRPGRSHCKSMARSSPPANTTSKLASKISRSISVSMRIAYRMLARPTYHRRANLVSDFPCCSPSARQFAILPNAAICALRRATVRCRDVHPTDVRRLAEAPSPCALPPHVAPVRPASAGSNAANLEAVGNGDPRLGGATT